MTGIPRDAAAPRATCACQRRDFIRGGLAAAAALWLPGCAATTAQPRVDLMSAGRNPDIAALDAVDALNGGADPFPIPWLDRNGSHNQSPGPGMEPSNIFHFRGRVARANDFTGVGTVTAGPGAGQRMAFGAKSTDFSFMEGEYFAGREVRRGAFAHL